MQTRCSRGDLAGVEKHFTTGLKFFDDPAASRYIKSTLAFLLVKRIVPVMLARWRLLAAASAIVLWSIVMAGVGAFAAAGKSGRPACFMKLSSASNSPRRFLSD